ncbi:PAS domain S-box protein [Bradyrhizobium sp. PMVTL-01]|uniref:PAS domain S-box protein n=1 Tax=Bradyrhizobium sp. PMVTL-01 TaxID=3434999 RepID=UPI003F6FDD2E
MKDAREQQAATAEILKVIASSPSDVQPVFEAIVANAARLIGGFSAGVYRFVDGMVHLEAAKSVTPAGDALLRASFPRPIADHFAVALAGHVLQIADIEDNPNERLKELGRLRGFRSVLYVPLKSSGMSIGVIAVSRQTVGSFAAHHIELLQTFADQAVIAIENARLFKEVQDKSRDLEEALNRYRTLVDHASDAFFLYDEDATVLDANRQACENLGYRRDELIGMTAFDFGPDLTPALLKRIRERLRAGKIVAFDGRHRRKDGTVFPVEVRIRPLWHEGQLRAVSLDRDITERKRAEDELRASEERFRTLLQFSFDVYWETDAEHRFIRQEFSERVTDGPLPGSELGKTRWEVPYLGIDEEGWRKHREMLDAHLPFRDLEYARPTPNGGVRWAAVSGLPVFDHAGHFTGYRGVGRHITDRKRVEAELLESREKFRVLSESSLTGIYLIEGGRFGHVNPAFANMFGYTTEEVVHNLGPLDLVHPDDRPLVTENIRRRSEGEVEEVHYEFRALRKDGSVFPAEVHGGAIEHNGKLAILGTILDNTQRKKAERELRDSEERFRTLIQFSFDVYWETDEQHRFTRQVFAEGLSDAPAPGSELGKTRWEVPYLEPDEEAWQRHRQTLDAHLPFRDFELARPTPDGGKRYVSVYGLPMFDESGRFLGYRGVGRDITERKKAEVELRESEESFRALVQFSFDLYWETDAQHRFTRQEFGPDVAFLQPQSPEWVDAYASPIGKRPWELPFLEPDAEAWRKHREAREAHQPFRDFEVARPSADGGKRYISVSGLPMFDKSGIFIGYRGVARDITDRKRADEARRLSETYLAAAETLSKMGSWAWRPAANEITHWSKGRYHLFGFDPAGGIPSLEAVIERIHPGDRAVWLESRSVVARGGETDFDFRIVLPDGTTKQVHAIGRPILNQSGEVVEVMGAAVDVTDQRQAQEERERLRQLELDLAHMSRVSIMGQLTASLAHEILHPIATARNNARAGMRFLEMSPPNLAEVMEALGCIVRDADRAKDIIGRIRDHIKKAPPRIEPFDVNEAIDEVLVMVRGAIDKNRVSVRTSLADQMPCVHGDRVQLQQVFLNLILNALDAMSSAEEEARELTISSEPSPTGGILIAVRDSGPGIDPEHLDQIFKPFHTTKSSGLGMGLSICRSIIDAHGGRLWAEANQPRGAVFQFTLPRAVEDS